MSFYSLTNIINCIVYVILFATSFYFGNLSSYLYLYLYVALVIIKLIIIKKIIIIIIIIPLLSGICAICDWVNNKSITFTNY